MIKRQSATSPLVGPALNEIDWKAHALQRVEELHTPRKRNKVAGRTQKEVDIDGLDPKKPTSSTATGNTADASSMGVPADFAALQPWFDAKAVPHEKRPEFARLFEAVVNPPPAIRIRRPRKTKDPRLSALEERLKWRNRGREKWFMDPLDFVEDVYPDRRAFGLCLADLRDLDIGLYRRLIQHGSIDPSFGLPTEQQKLKSEEDRLGFHALRNEALTRAVHRTSLQGRRAHQPAVRR